MEESKLHVAMQKYVLSWRDWVSNYFPQLQPKMKKEQPASVPCCQCGCQHNPDREDVCQCVHHGDSFLLTVPTQHVGLVMGKGRIKRNEIFTSSGVSLLIVPKIGEGLTGGGSDIEIKGVPAAVKKAEMLIRKSVQRQAKLSPGRWRCCQRAASATGCQTSEKHVIDTILEDQELLVETRECVSSPVRVFALDCEWVLTSRGGELARVSVLDYRGDVCYDTLVLPPRPIADYNTRFSGITASLMEGVTMSLREVQEDLHKMICSKDVLVGHSIHHDLQALHLVHRKVVDTSEVFPHKDGPNKKNSLRFLAKQFLMRDIQQEQFGHDSKEDALACLDLMKLKIAN
eukprot:GFUD01034561.1.p1 GENE.GFUD01034561.1~~GFUD01034561.1.p1  ORF type:complete len:344 (-),score=103.00 GFUD01034561.1:55-1086(-)